MNGCILLDALNCRTVCNLINYKTIKNSDLQAYNKLTKTVVVIGIA